MLVINDNKMKLLKMKEKLLEVSAIDKNNTLKEYAELVKDIDNDCYNQIIRKIKKCNYNDLNLEEQMKFLSEIEEDYNYLNQLQCMIRNVYSKYTDEELQLSDINNILIDTVIQRISDIQGYLMNVKNLESNKIEIDRLNHQLISLDKENEHVKRVLADIKNNLRNDLIKAEGRIYNSNGSMDMISIVSELKKYGIDLKEVINDEAMLKQIFQEFNNEKNMQNETYEAAINLPNKDEEICKQIEVETINAKYKFCLIDLINEICNSSLEYNAFKDSLYKIVDIINLIKGYLQRLGIRFYINPFDRIKIDSKIQMVNSIRDCNEEINKIKKTITYISTMIEEANGKSYELMNSINTPIEIIRDNKKDANVSQYALNENDAKAFGDIALNNALKDNQVVSLNAIGDGFKIDRVREKTDGVIKRVYEMLNYVPVVNDDVKIPELVLAPLDEYKNDLNEDNSADVKEDADLDFDSLSANVATEDNSNMIFLDNSMSENGKDNDLFHEVIPFEEASLFSDRYDSGIFEDERKPQMILDLSTDKNDKPMIEGKTNLVNFGNGNTNDELNSMMPDAFWITKDDDIESNKNDDNVLSFDEQVEALMNNNEQVKIKKKAA